jgi:hypothetical protein
MSLSKKERRLTIWIGIAIGVACSSMLVRYAFNQKEIKAKERPGNYNSGRTAADQKAFPPLPFEAQKDLPHGIVVFHDYNQSILNGSENSSSWVVETTGNFRSKTSSQGLSIIFVLPRFTSYSNPRKIQLN